jgi:FkbM family methyltransferase
VERLKNRRDIVPVISYAQNFEDIILWRALSNIPQGFYIDIGAQDPTLDSVSRLFYEKGWRGIHVDANADFCSLLRRDRPDEQVIQAAVGAEAGLLTFFEFPGTGLSTAVQKIADQHREAGWPMTTTQVPSVTLDLLFEGLGDREVHWLKIDVEGYERKVIEGWQGSQRPWIVVVEAMAPFGTHSTHDTYESELLAKGYHYTLFDGLNRFYVSDDHPELDRHFEHGPSCFDEIQIPQESRLAQHLVEQHGQVTIALQQENEAQLRRLASEEAARHETERQRGELARDVERLEAELADFVRRNESTNQQLHLSLNLVSTAETLRAKLAADLSAADAQRGAAQQSLAEAEVRCGTLTANLSAAEAQLEQTVAERAVAQKSLSEAEARCEVLTAELSAAEVRHENISSQLNSTVVKLEQAEEALVRYALVVGRLDQTAAFLQVAEGKLVNSKTAQDTLTAELAALNQRFIDTVAAHKRDEAELAAQSILIGRLSGQLESIFSSWWWRLAKPFRFSSATDVGVDDLARIGQGIRPRESAGEVRPNDQEFIESAYLGILRRRADDEGLLHYLRQLAAGRVREDIITELRQSPEGQALGIDTTAQTFNFGTKSTRDAAATEDGVRAVLNRTGVDFVREAYAMVLGRQVDPEGEKHYMRQLESGAERLDVLADLRWSAEGQSLEPAGYGLWLATDWRRWQRVRWMGSFLRKRALRRFMQPHAHRLAAMLTELDRLEAIAASPQTPTNLPPGHLAPVVMTQAQPQPSAEHGAAPDDLSNLHLNLNIDVAWQGHGAGGDAQSAAAALRPVLSQPLDINRVEPEWRILCSGDVPKDGESETPMIWYSVEGREAELEPLQQLPDGIKAIACSSATRARQAIDRGLGVIAVSVAQDHKRWESEEEDRRGVAGQIADLTQRLSATTAPRKVIESREKSRVALLTTWNTVCGIAAHSAELAGGFQDADMRIYAANQFPRVQEDEPNVFRRWYSGKSENRLSQVLDHLRESPVDLLIIQFNFDFFEHKALVEFIQAAADMGVIVMVVIHSTVEQHTDWQNWRLADLVAGLQRCGRVIVHAPKDISKLAEMGVNNVLLMPHGVAVRVSQARRGMRDGVPVLSSFGFCFPNKGLIELVHAVGILRDRGVNVKLKMLNAVHKDPSSAATMDKIKSTIIQLGLSNAIEVISDYLDFDTVDSMIAETDLFVNSYQETGESASGAVRIGLRMGLPTVVTPLPIFDDLGEAVFRMPGTTPEDMAEGVLSALRTVKAGGAEAQRVASALDKWLALHDFRRQAHLLSNICRSLQLMDVLKNAGSSQ